MSDEGHQASIYQSVVEAIVARIWIASDALSEVDKSGDNPMNFVGCELAVLQVRLICELMLLGATSAHLVEAGLDLRDNEWRPKHAFYDLSQQSEHPLPFPIVLQSDDERRSHHATPISQPVSFEALSRIYGICGDLLHAPTFRQVSKNRMPEFDVPLIWSWVNGFRELLLGHALFLPERKIGLICVWSGKRDEQPTAFRIDAKGQSTLDLSTFPPFSLLQ